MKVPGLWIVLLLDPADPEHLARTCTHRITSFFHPCAGNSPSAALPPLPWWEETTDWTGSFLLLCLELFQGTRDKARVSLALASPTGVKASVERRGETEIWQEISIFEIHRPQSHFNLSCSKVLHWGFQYFCTGCIICHFTPLQFASG